MNKERLTDIQKYKLTIWAYQHLYVYDDNNDARSFEKRLRNMSHKHHVKPKSLYPRLANDNNNIVEVPAIVHWALHKWLLAYYQQTNNSEAIDKMSKVNLEDFINQQLEEINSDVYFDFSRENDILDEIECAVWTYIKCYFKKKKYIDEYKLSKFYRVSYKNLSESDQEIKHKYNANIKEATEDEQFMRKVLQYMNKNILDDFSKSITDELDCIDDEDAENITSISFPTSFFKEFESIDEI